MKVGEQLRIMIREDRNWRAVRFSATWKVVEMTRDLGGETRNLRRELDSRDHKGRDSDEGETTRENSIS